MWRQVIAIAYNVENRTNKPLQFKLRGYSAIEIAIYLLRKRKDLLSKDEVEFLREVK